MSQNKFTTNNNPTLVAVSNADGETPVYLYADPSTHGLVVSATISSAGIATSANQTNGTQLTQIVDAGGDAVTVTGGKLDVNATASLAGTTLPISGATTGVGVAILDSSGNQISSFGGGTQYAEGVTTSPATGTAFLGRYEASPSGSSADGGMYAPLMDNFHQLKVVPVGTVSVSGTVTANAGTNLNTSALALESGGNLAAINAKLVSGTDIGDVTINNATGADAVNVQDGGNSLTVDNSGTFPVQATLSAETTKVIGTVNQGTSPWVTSNATTSVVGNGAAATAQRVTLANDSTGVIATVGAVTSITNALPAGTNAIGKLAANSGVDIGDVDVTSLPAWGTVSTANSTSTNLAGGAVFTGTSENVSGYASIQVTVFSSHASATDGLSLQQSSNGTNWDIVDTYTIPATTGKAFSVQPATNFYRLVYTNGATLTTSLRIQTVFHVEAPNPSSQRTTDAYTNETDLTQQWTFNSLYNGTTWDRMRGDTANGLDVDVTRLPALVAGSALIGKVGIDQTTPGTTNAVVDTPVTSGGLSIVTGSVGATATAIKASAGQLYGYHLFNTTAAVAYVQIFNVASGSVTLGTTAPTFSIGIPASGGVTVNFDKGIAFSTAISFACTTTRTGSSGATCDVNFFYK